MKHLAFLTTILAFQSFNTFSQPFSGVYTIGGTSPDFPTTQAAITALAQNGVGGQVIFNFRPGTYSGMVLLNPIQGISALNNVIFQAESLDSSSVKINRASLPIIRLRDQQHFTFQHLTIQPNASSTQASAFFAEFCDDITINHCYVQYDGPTSGGNDHAAVQFTHRFDGPYTICQVMNTTLTGTATCINTTGSKGKTLVAGCTLNSTGPYSLQSYYQGILSIDNNAIVKKINVTFCTTIYLRNNVLEDEVELGTNVKQAKGNRFLSTQGCRFNYVELLDSNYFTGPADLVGTHILRNVFADQVHFGHSGNTMFHQNHVEGGANFAFCNGLNLQRNEFRGQVNLAFCDNSKVFTNLFHQYCGIAICHNVQVIHNNFGPASVFDFASYEGLIAYNIFSRELEGYVLFPDNIFTGNNYYPSGGRYDKAPYFIPPDYPDSGNLRPQNPFLIGKGNGGAPPTGADFDSHARPFPASLGAFELCMNPGDTILVPCGDVLRLSLCQMPAAGIWHWTPAETLDDPKSPRPFASPHINTRYVVTDSLSGWSDTLWVIVVPYRANLPDTISILCGQNVLLSPQSHGNAAYFWSPPAGLSSDTSANPLAMPEISTTYHLEAEVPGCGIYADSVYFDVDPMPRAFASYQQNGNVIQFENFSDCAETYLWDFGDGQTSTAFEPEHIYADTGQYQVFLVAINNFGRDTIFGTIQVWFTLLSHDPIKKLELNVFPNPFSTEINLDIPDNSSGPVTLKLFDALGRLVWQKEEMPLAASKCRFMVPDLPAGFYVGQFNNSGRRLGQVKLLRKGS